MSDQIAAYRADRDAFGHMLVDQFSGQEAVEIIEQEDGFIIASMRSRRYFSGYQDWDPVEQEAMRWLVPGRVLDLGCGAGRVALYLQDHGYEVAGVDVSFRGLIEEHVAFDVEREEVDAPLHARRPALRLPSLIDVEPDHSLIACNFGRPGDPSANSRADGPPSPTPRDAEWGSQRGGPWARMIVVNVPRLI